jgi:hypothetical protein
MTMNSAIGQSVHKDYQTTLQAVLTQLRAIRETHRTYYLYVTVTMNHHQRMSAPTN